MATKARSVADKAVFALLAVGLLLGSCASGDQTVALSETDRGLMDRAVQQSLETDKVGQSRNWANPDSGHVGTVTPLRTFTKNSGRPCRDYQQTVTIGGITRLAYDTACRQPSGDWNSLDSGGLAGFDSYRPSYPPGGYAYGHHDHGYPYYRPDHYRGHFIYGPRHHHRGHGFSFGYGHYF